MGFLIRSLIRSISRGGVPMWGIVAAVVVIGLYIYSRRS